MRPNNGKVPPHTYDALKRYVDDRLPPGSFLTAVLENNLKAACACADNTNRHFIFDIVQFCYNDIPASCWGSPKKVKDWLKGNHVKEKEESSSPVTA